MRTTIIHRQLWPDSGAMGQAGRVDLIWLLLALAVCAGLIYVGYRIEPHHVSKDGRRFLATGQWISNHGEPEGRRREVWVDVMSGGRLQVAVKRRVPHNSAHWTIEGKSMEPPPRRAVYVLRSGTSAGTTQRMTLQVPAKSRAVAILDETLSAPS
jgi:hypothetical protein